MITTIPDFFDRCAKIRSIGYPLIKFCGEIDCYGTVNLRVYDEEYDNRLYHESVDNAGADRWQLVEDMFNRCEGFCRGYIKAYNDNTTKREVNGDE